MNFLLPEEVHRPEYGVLSPFPVLSYAGCDKLPVRFLSSADIHYGWECMEHRRHKPLTVPLTAGFPFHLCCRFPLLLSWKLLAVLQRFPVLQSCQCLFFHEPPHVFNIHQCCTITYLLNSVPVSAADEAFQMLQEYIPAFPEPHFSSLQIR